MSELKLCGHHNVLNALTSLSLAFVIEKNPKKFARALKKFKALDHRTQEIYSSKEFCVIDDSKATNTSATIAALNSFGDPLVLILGGDLKGQTLDNLCLSVEGRQIMSFVFGKDKTVIYEAFKERDLPIEMVDDLNRLTKNLKNYFINLGNQKISKPCTVLFSPACASTDMFRNLSLIHI